MSWFKKINLPSTNMVMTVAAVVISMCALFVSFAEVRIMRSQQKASLYPHLSLGQRYNDEGFGLYLENKGIGPARINSFQVFYGDIYFNDWVSLARHFLPDSLQQDMGWQNMKMSNIQNSIIAPGEKLTLVWTGWTPTSRLLLEPMETLDSKLCYSSLLNEHWVINGSAPPEEVSRPCTVVAEKEMN